MAPGTERDEVSVRGVTLEQRRRVRLTTWVVSLIALAFYVGFIVLTVMRSRH
jgi:uncharacterized membrane protein (DUF485 family)